MYNIDLLAKRPEKAPTRYNKSMGMGICAVQMTIAISASFYHYLRCRRAAAPTQQQRRAHHRLPPRIHHAASMLPPRRPHPRSHDAALRPYSSPTLQLLVR